TPSTLSPRTIGNPNAPCSPSRPAISARGKFVSATTSRIQAGSPVAQTRPGRPTPVAKVRRRLRASNRGNDIGGGCHVSTHSRARGARDGRARAALREGRDDVIAHAKRARWQALTGVRRALYRTSAASFAVSGRTGLSYDGRLDSLGARADERGGASQEPP